MAVAVFVPCFIAQLAPQVAEATVSVLTKVGVDAVVPRGLVCCGQPLANAGYERLGARPLARVAAGLAKYETIVVPSGSCAAHLKAHAGERVAGRTTELCAFLHGAVGVGAVAKLRVTCDRRVAVHIGCHALRGLGLAPASELGQQPVGREAPDIVRALLATVRGLTVVEARRVDECCGFGGTYAVKEPEVSVAIGRDRVRSYRETGAEAVVSTDVSCLLHLDGVARRCGAAEPLPMWHVAEVLAGMVS
jgi:L-lactate dehydrogenase complex protein LldE